MCPRLALSKLVQGKKELRKKKANITKEERNYGQSQKREKRAPTPIHTLHKS